MQFMSRTAPQSSAKMARTVEEDKKYKKALRFIYKFGQESNKLTDEAVEACKRQGINPDDLVMKTLEDFAVHPSSAGTTSKPKDKHQAELLQSEQNLAEVRFRHHQNRRKSK